VPFAFGVVLDRLAGEYGEMRAPLETDESFRRRLIERINATMLHASVAENKRRAGEDTVIFLTDWRPRVRGRGC
jgi:uncharacterized phage protein gp47/JayE